MYVRLLNYSCVIYGRSRLAKASGRCTIQTSSRAINTKKHQQHTIHTFKCIEP